MLMLLLVDDTSPRFGGSPDPDGERERRWQPIDRRVLVPVLGSFSCLIGSSAAAADEPALAYGLTFAALGLCAMAARTAVRGRASQDPSKTDS